MLELLKDFAGFMKERKKYWLAPIVIVVMLLLGLLIVFAHGSAVAPLHLHLVLTLALLHRDPPSWRVFYASFRLQKIMIVIRVYCRIFTLFSRIHIVGLFLMRSTCL
ncbi:MAG: DUF5989 family protein [Pseudomonadales bacterium]